MKKTAIIAIIFILFVFLFAGCGQKMDVTVYNTTGITQLAQQYVQMSAWLDQDQGSNYTQIPTGDAKTEAYCDDTNSFTIKAKENQTLSVYSQGYYYQSDSSGNTSLVHFEDTTVTKTLTGGMLSTPHWYAAIYLNNIVIYEK